MNPFSSKASQPRNPLRNPLRTESSTEAQLTGTKRYSNAPPPPQRLTAQPLPVAPSTAPPSAYQASRYQASAQDTKQLTKAQIKKSVINSPNVRYHNLTLDNETIKQFMVNVLTKYANMGKAETELLFSDKESTSIMRTAFTHWSIPNEINYEMYETLGDKTYNKALMWYIMRRFPELRTDPAANEKLTEASKLYQSAQKMAGISEKLGLPALVRYAELEYSVNDKYAEQGFVMKTIEMDNKMKTDVLEAFVGGLEDLLDGKVCPGAGYTIVYNILQDLFDEMKDMTIDLRFTKPATSILHETVTQNSGKEKWRILQDNNKLVYGTELELFFDHDIYCKGNPITYKRFVVGDMRNIHRDNDSNKIELAQQALEWLHNECNIQWREKK